MTDHANPHRIDGDGGSGDGGWLGDDGILLHIGLPKSGTTALQTCLVASRSELLDHDILYPRAVSNRHRNVPNHVPAANAPLRWPQPVDQQASSDEMWSDLVRETRSHGGRVIVSAENLAVAADDVAADIVDQLGAGRTRVMVTTRPLHVLLPSFWQNEVRSGLRTPYVDWLRLMMAGPGAAEGRAPFWILYDLGTVVARWVDIVGADRVALVVVDSDRPAGIYTDVERLVGLPRGTLDPARSRRTNRSLSAPEAELIRQLNCRVPGAVSDTRGGAYGPASVGDAAIWKLLAGRDPDPDEPRLTFPAELAEQVERLSSAAVEEVRAIGPRVIGDLDALVPAAARRRPGETGASVDEADVEVPLDVVVLLVDQLMRATATPEVAATEAP